MLFVGIGGFFGAITRFQLGKWISRRITTSSFFYGTWVINITGSFLLGLLAMLHMKTSLPDWTWLLMGTGFLGAYTTFSTFGYETIQLLEKKKIKSALIYVSSSVIVGVFFAWVGGLVGSGFIYSK